MLLQLGLSISLWPMTRGGRETRVNIEALLGDEVGSGSLGHVATPDPS
jgi:hypothetical protein